MTNEEYKTECKRIRKEYEDSINRLNFEFVKTMPNRLKIGDIATNELFSIIVDKTMVSYQEWNNDGVPTAIYEGYRIKKDGERFKNDERRSVSHTSLLSKLTE